MASSKRRKRGRKVLATVLIIFAVLISVGAITVKLLKDRVTKAYGQKNTTEILSATVTRGRIGYRLPPLGSRPEPRLMLPRPNRSRMSSIVRSIF